ncbi:MAG: glucuronyl hydrolase [Proteiniphilum sp.]
MNKLFGVIILLATSLSTQSCKSDIIQQNFRFAEQQIEHTLELVHLVKQNDSRDAETKARNPLVSPRTIDEEGNLIMVRPRDWTSGFFPGELWFIYEYTREEKWRAKAEEFTANLEGLRNYKGTHDLGFMVYNSFGNGLRLTNRADYREIVMDAARSLASRYKPNAGIIRSWDHNGDKWECPVIIDNMMNLELLFWATRESGDSIFYAIAVSHADKTMENHFRPDYGTYHVVDYDTITGEVLNRHTHQGYAHESTWSRGEAWALYGYTMTYRETKEEAYRTHANRIADFIFSHPNLPGDLIPYWDFDAPGIPDEPRDVSAATITASALYELSSYGGEKAGQYKQWADTILENLTNHYRAGLHTNAGFLLLHSTGAKSLNSEIDVPLVYADYYFLEALTRKQKLEKNQSLF